MDDNYEAHKEQAAERQAAQSKKGRDIGFLPPVVDPDRKEACRHSLRLDLETYYPETFEFGWSDDHIEFIDDVEAVILSGGRKAVGMPRGSGKTSILARAANWGLKYGHRFYLALIGAEEDSAKGLADIIRAEWEVNNLLAEDFPEIAYPISRLEGINNRANGQTYRGKRTKIVWNGADIRFPTIEGSVASGATIGCAGILCRIRGLQYVDPRTKKTRRPDCCLIDDFQTDASARSVVQCSTRELTINGAVMGLAGPGKTLACLASSTIIKHGDAASRMFNRVLYPRWRASVYRLIYEWPKGEEADRLWAEYLQVRAAELADGVEDHPAATRFYARNREAMDHGHRAAWEFRKLPHEISAIQHAVGLRADNPATFDAEYQNDPKDVLAQLSGLRVATSDEMVVKQDSHARGSAPVGAGRVTVGIDVQGSSLWWVMMTFAEDYAGWHVDRGVWPPQPGLGEYFTLSQIENEGVTIAKATGEHRPEAALRIALTSLTESLFKRRIKTPTGEVLKPDLAMIDDGYMSRHVQAFCRMSSHAVMPCKGVGVKASNVPWERQRRKPGERRGPGWKMPPVMRTDEIRHVVIDTNYWGTFLANRWSTPVGSPGSYSFYRAPHVLHRMAADHLTSESATETYGQGRTVYEWKLKPGQENHWRDAERMASVGASILGIRIDAPSTKESASKPKASGPKKSMALRRAEAKAKQVVNKKPSIKERREAKKKGR